MSINNLFFSKNEKNIVYPCKPQFYFIKVGLKGVKLYWHVFLMQKAFGVQEIQEKDTKISFLVNNEGNDTKFAKVSSV